MAHSRCAFALLRRSLRAEFASGRPANGARCLASLSGEACGWTGSSSGSERAGWKTRAGVLGGGVAAVAGFMSLLHLQQPVVARGEGVQQIEMPGATETIVASKDTPRNLSADTIAHLLAELRAACDEDRVVVDKEEREFHAKPWNTYHSVDAIPDIVVHPKTQEEVVAVVRACAKYKVPVTPFAGGTSLEGHTMTPYKGVTINMNSMKKVKELHLEDMDVIVEPELAGLS